MLNRMVPKPADEPQISTIPFGTMLNRMVPKHIVQFTSIYNTFGTMLNRMVPKPRILLFNMIGVD